MVEWFLLVYQLECLFVVIRLRVVVLSCGLQDELRNHPIHQLLWHLHLLSVFLVLAIVLKMVREDDIHLQFLLIVYITIPLDISKSTISKLRPSTAENKGVCPFLLGRFTFAFASINASINWRKFFSTAKWRGESNPVNKNHDQK